MTEYTLTHPLWMWIYFGAFGLSGAILFTLILWQLMKYHVLARGYLRSAARWNIIGYAFLFSAAWFACGVGGTPGNLLSPDPAAHNPAVATSVAALSIFLSVPGWACLLVAQSRLLRGAQSGPEAHPQ
jgi:hypothetical protein